MYDVASEQKNTDASSDRRQIGHLAVTGDVYSQSYGVCMLLIDLKEIFIRVWSCVQPCGFGILRRLIQIVGKFGGVFFNFSWSDVFTFQPFNSNVV